MNLQRSKINNVHYKGQSKLFLYGRFWKPFHATFPLSLPESLKGLYDEKQAAKVSWVDRSIDIIFSSYMILSGPSFLIQSDPIWSNLIQSDPIWSNLVQSDLIWTNLIQHFLEFFRNWVLYCAYLNYKFRINCVHLNLCMYSRLRNRRRAANKRKAWKIWQRE